MSNYNTVLVGVDLTDASTDIANRAQQIAENNGAKLHLIHVIEPLSFAYGGDIPMDFSGIQEEIHQQARQQLINFAAIYGIHEDSQHIVFGRPEMEIHSLAEDLNADLVVVGSHGRYGLALLMGSTANGVLHGATCDVLAVRVAS